MIWNKFLFCKTNEELKNFLFENNLPNTEVENQRSNNPVQISSTCPQIITQGNRTSWTVCSYQLI